MPIRIDNQLTAQKLVPKIERLFELSAAKILAIEKSWKPSNGTPVFTVKGRYTSRGWTEWTQGFQFGSALLQFEATGEKKFLEIGRRNTVEKMATHVSHVGVHDHGFNNISTYGNLLRLMREGKIPFNEHEKNFYELALKVSGAVQAARWTKTADGNGFIYSFNGPHSLFIDTLRSLRSLAVAHRLGHVLMGERDQKISLLQRLVEHATTTARYNVYYGKGRDAYDVCGRTAHESIFNVNDGSYRCPNSQQGYSPFSTWTRGLAWAILGFAEQLEFLKSISENELDHVAHNLPWNHIIPPRQKAVQGLPDFTLTQILLNAAIATADFYLESGCRDGVPMWDTGAPRLDGLNDYFHKPADPFNFLEPVDSSAAAIAAQGLFRLGTHLIMIYGKRAVPKIPRSAERVRARIVGLGCRYRQASLTIANTLFSEPYLSTNSKHQGLILHSVYHRPNGWDYIAPGQKIPNGESSMWGDYHARELALLLWREARREKYLTFFGGVD
ncbi:MAG: glycoside hydrolase family 88 protein [Verrucomicrobia bacterium]|nr:glycoside hydrolase family 88 protein [Verrucomicrobiota bacterium]